MDALFAISGKGFALIAADCSAVRSIIAYKHDEDKMYKLDDHKVVAAGGEQADRSSFVEYVQRNMALDLYRSGIKKTTKATAHMIRSELATALRKAPKQVSLLLVGYDEPDAATLEAAAAEDEAKEGEEAAPKPEGTASVYWMDYMGTLQKVNYAAHGYAGYFCSATMDRFWKPGMSEEEVVDLLGRCIGVLRARFLAHMPNFRCRIVDANGVREVEVPVHEYPQQVAPAGAAAAAAAAGGDAMQDEE